MGYLAWKRRSSFALGYNPYEVLGVPYGSAEDDIRRQFRLLSLQVHPDRVLEAEEVAAECRFVEISKAYKALTDADLRRDYEKTGHPDGNRNMTLGIAFPSWLEEKDNAVIVLAVYFAFFGVGFPFLVARWWYISKAYSKTGVHYKTMALFYKELIEGITPLQVAEIICAAFEFQEAVKWTSNDSKTLSELLSKVKSRIAHFHNGDKLEENRISNSLTAQKSHVLLLAYLYRIPVEHSDLLESQRFVIQTCSKLLRGLVQIAIAKDWVEVLITLLKFEKMLVQAVHSPTSYFLQLPLVNYDVSEELAKLNLPDKKPCRVPKDLVLANRNDLSNFLKVMVGSSSEKVESCVDNVLAVAASIPKVVLVKPIIEVIGQDRITPGSLITAAFYACLAFSDREESICKNRDAFSLLDLESMVSISYKSGVASTINKWSGVSDEVLVHCPHFPCQKFAAWTALLSIGPPPNVRPSLGQARSFITTPHKIQQFPIARNYFLKYSPTAILPPVVIFQFAAPHQPGPLFLALEILSDSWLNCDFHCDIKINVTEAPNEDLVTGNSGISEEEAVN